MKKKMMLITFISALILLSLSYIQPLFANVDELVILEKTIKKTDFAKDGKTVILTSNYSYPEIENLNNVEAITQVNNKISEFAKKRFMTNYRNGLEYATQFISNISDGQKMELPHFLPYTIDLIYDIKLKRKNIISILYADSTWFGGAHPNVEWKSQTYNLVTGEELKATDILVWNNQKIKKFIADEFMKKMKENPLEFFENDVQELQKLEFDYDYILTEQGIEFYFNPYEIAPYVAGRVSVVFPYKSNKEAYKEEIYNFINS